MVIMGATRPSLADAGVGEKPVDRVRPLAVGSEIEAGLLDSGTEPAGRPWDRERLAEPIAELSLGGDRYVRSARTSTIGPLASVRASGDPTDRQGRPD